MIHRPAWPLRPAPAWLALAVAACAVAPLSAWSATGIEPADVAQAVALASQAARALGPAGARIETRPGQLDRRLKLAPCARVQAFLPAGSKPWGKSRVGLRCLHGAVAWQVFLPVTVRVWAPAVVSIAPLPGGARVDASQLTLAEVDWAAASSPPFAAPTELDERVLARPLAAWQPLRASDLRAREWFKQGETVRVVAQGSGFAVSTEGQAMNAGIEGHRVRVRTESGRVVVGVPVGRNRVELGS